MGDEASPQPLPSPAGRFDVDSAQRREEMLGLLRESLAEWESRVDWDTLPESRRIALNTLAEESASTLRELIRNFEARSGATGQAGPQESRDGGA